MPTVATAIYPGAALAPATSDRLVNGSRTAPVASIDGASVDRRRQPLERRARRWLPKARRPCAGWWPLVLRAGPALALGLSVALVRLNHGRLASHGAPAQPSALTHQWVQAMSRDHADPPAGLPWAGASFPRGPRRRPRRRGRTLHTDGGPFPLDT